MNTLVKKASVMWADEDTKTALNAWELLLAQRFVIYAQFSCFGMTSRFCSVDRPRSLRALADQAGNSMPVQLVRATPEQNLHATQVNATGVGSSRICTQLKSTQRGSATSESARSSGQEDNGRAESARNSGQDNGRNRICTLQLMSTGQRPQQNLHAAQSSSSSALASTAGMTCQVTSTTILAGNVAAM